MKIEIRCRCGGELEVAGGGWAMVDFAGDSRTHFQKLHCAKCGAFFMQQPVHDYVCIHPGKGNAADYAGVTVKEELKGILNMGPGPKSNGVDQGGDTE